MTDDFGGEVSSEAEDGHGGDLPLIYFGVGLLLRTPLLFRVGLVLPAGLLPLFPQALPRPRGTKEKKEKERNYGGEGNSIARAQKEIGGAYSSMVRAEGAFLFTLRPN